MSALVETRRIKIANRVIKSHDIRRLFSDIANEVKRLDETTEKEIENELSNKMSRDSVGLEKERNERLQNTLRRESLTVTAIDDSTYEGGAAEILIEGGIIDSKQISSIDFYFIDGKRELSLFIRLLHTNSGMSNEIKIQGRDSIWVNGVTKKIEDFVNSLESQATWAKKYALVLAVIFDLCMATIVNGILSYSTLHLELNPSAKARLVYVTTKGPSFVFLTGMCLFPALLLMHKVQELWPLVELQTGQTHHQVERQRRNHLWLVFTLLILPAVLTLLFEAI